MRRKCVLIMIDSAARDGLSQLLVAHYLRRHGVRVVLCNQLTLSSVYERYRPQVMYVTWVTNSLTAAYLQRLRHKTRIVLVDQEGGRMGEEAFKRSMRGDGRTKINLASAATRVIAWGPLQAQWIKETTALGADRIVVTGCPRFDPYLVVPDHESDGRNKYLGITLRADRITSKPITILESVFESLFVDLREGLAPGLPFRARYEDWVWQAVAVTRYMFQIITEVAQRTDVPIVLRPGPWEQPRAYDFLPKRLPHVSVEPSMLQHEYVRQAFATVDTSSALGLESLVANIPVISVNALVPGLEEHVGGVGGTRFHSPYRKFYWHPTTVEEAVECILKAQQGALPRVPSEEGLADYFRDYLHWPSQRPASFRIGELLLELLELPPASGLPPVEPGGTEEWTEPRRWLFYRLPASASVQQLRLYRKFVVESPDRQFYRRYHYFDWSYPHHRAIHALFTRLWREHGINGRGPRATTVPVRASGSGV